MCKKCVRTDFFINFMDELRILDPDNNIYYLLDNARVHKSKKFMEYLENNKMNIVYNAPYHSEINKMNIVNNTPYHSKTNPIENIFSMLRNYLNRNKNETKLEL